MTLCSFVVDTLKVLSSEKSHFEGRTSLKCLDWHWVSYPGFSYLRLCFSCTDALVLTSLEETCSCCSLHLREAPASCFPDSVTEHSHLTWDLFRITTSSLGCLTREIDLSLPVVLCPGSPRNRHSLQLALSSEKQFTLMQRTKLDMPFCWQQFLIL